MRRSLLMARSGFHCPVKGQASQTTPSATASSVKPETVTAPTTTTPTSTIESEQSGSTAGCEPPATKKMRPVFKSPMRDPQEQAQGEGTTAAAVSVVNKKKEEEDLPPRAFKVFWTTFSKKKHKTYADGILVLNGVAAKLLNEEGKEVAKCNNMGRSNVESLIPGNTLLIQSKELEINKQIPFEEYSSGRVFVSVGKPSLGESTTSVSRISAAAMKPFKKLGGLTSATEEELPPPRHNPDAPGAFVLQEGGPKSVAIVVDPYISRRLRPHQRDGIKFVFDCVMGKHGAGKGCILADEMGLGKSLQALTVLWTLLKQGPTGRPLVSKAIIVCPNTLIGNWAQEISTWLGRERLIPLTLSSAKSKNECIRILREFKSDKNPVLIISYEQLRNNVDALTACRCGFLICDEAHRIKNAQSKTAIALTKLSTERRVLLTGTPIQNDLTEFYTMVDFCSPSLLGTLTAFRNTFEIPISRGSDPASTPEQRDFARQRAANLEAVTSSVVLRRLSTILSNYLPHKTELVLVCRPTETQAALYKKCLLSKSVKSLISDVRTEASVPSLSCIHRLTKICGHPGLLLPQDPDSKELLLVGTSIDDDDEYAENGDDDEDGGSKTKAKMTVHARKDDDEEDEFVRKLCTAFGEPEQERLKKGDPIVEMSGKLTVLDRLMAGLYEHSDEKIVLVSNFTKTLDWFERLCQFRGYQYRRLDGSTEQSKRQQLVDYFNHSSQKGCFVFLLSCKAGGLGINLCGASRLVLFDPDWNPAWDRQSMARIWRDGQKRPVIIYRMLTTGTIEEKIFQRQLSKQSLSRNVIIDTFESNKGFSRDDLKAVFIFNEHTCCDTHDLIGCKCSGETTTNKKKTQVTSSDAAECTAVLSHWSHFPTIDREDFPDRLLVTAMGSHINEISFAFSSDSTEVAKAAPVSTTVHSEEELKNARESMEMERHEVPPEDDVKSEEPCVPDMTAELDVSSSKEAASALFDYDSDSLCLSPF